MNIGAENKEIAATCAVYKILSRKCNPPIDVLTILNTVPKMVEFICHLSK